MQLHGRGLRPARCTVFTQPRADTGSTHGPTAVRLTHADASSASTARGAAAPGCTQVIRYSSLNPRERRSTHGPTTVRLTHADATPRRVSASRPERAITLAADLAMLATSESTFRNVDLWLVAAPGLDQSLVPPVRPMVTRPLLCEEDTARVALSYAALRSLVSDFLTRRAPHCPAVPVRANALVLQQLEGGHELLELLRCIRLRTHVGMDLSCPPPEGCTDLLACRTCGHS